MLFRSQYNIPRQKIILENHATNTGENIQFTKALLKEQGKTINSCITIQKPYAERRVFATCRQYWPELETIQSSPANTFSEYTKEIEETVLAHKVVGQIARIMQYPKQGFMTPQEMTQHVLDAYNTLIERQYTQFMPTP